MPWSREPCWECGHEILACRSVPSPRSEPVFCDRCEDEGAAVLCALHPRDTRSFCAMSNSILTWDLRSRVEIASRGELADGPELFSDLCGVRCDPEA